LAGGDKTARALHDFPFAARAFMANAFAPFSTALFETLAIGPAGEIGAEHIAFVQRSTGPG